MSTTGHALAFQTPSGLPGLAGFGAAPLSLAPPKRPRARLWELNASVHCSIVGTCLTTAELRRVMGKVTQNAHAASDHDLHGQAVGMCLTQGPAAKLLQKALDQRHEIVIKRFARRSGEAAIMEAWSDARRAGDIPGAYWAVLTHPDAGSASLRLAFGDVHMLSHLVGAANRADIRRLTALEEENAALRAKTERQELRLREAVTTRDETIRRLSALAARRMGEAPAGTGQPDDEESAEALRHLVADLQVRLSTEAARRERLERRAEEAVRAGRRSEARARTAETEAEAVRRELALLERQEDGAQAPPAAERVLYVGGRPSSVGAMRAMLEAAGGQLLCHDGGQHDHPSLLPGLIGQADRVAFPVDCVSHDAALTVKRLCRQLGKPWAPLRSSGLGSFLAMLTAPAPVAEAAVR